MYIFCCICIECVLPSEKLSGNVCGHVYHHACIIRWIERYQTCPVCRQSCTKELLRRIYFSATKSDRMMLHLLKIDAYKKLNDELMALRNEKQGLTQKITHLEEELRKLSLENHRSQEILIHNPD